MLHYDRTDIREGIDLARSSSKEFILEIIGSNLKILYAMVAMFYNVKY